jgi:putative transposase
MSFALKQSELGTPIEEVCRWRKKFGALGPSEVRRLKQLAGKEIWDGKVAA